MVKVIREKRKRGAPGSASPTAPPSWGGEGRKVDTVKKFTNLEKK